MSFSLSNRSLSRLEGVHPFLVEVAKLAIKRTEIDFGITCGVRTIEEQEAHVAAKRSWTMKSKHLIQDDGYSHAIDCVAYVGSDVCWEANVYDEIADAIKSAAEEVRGMGYEFDITWGSGWHKPLTQHEGTCEELSNEYVDLRRSQGRRPTMDSPHFQIENIS